MRTIALATDGTEFQQVRRFSRMKLAARHAHAFRSRHKRRSPFPGQEQVDHMYLKGQVGCMYTTVLWINVIAPETIEISADITLGNDDRLRSSGSSGGEH